MIFLKVFLDLVAELLIGLLDYIAASIFAILLVGSVVGCLYGIGFLIYTVSQYTIVVAVIMAAGVVFWSGRRLEKW